MMTPCSYLAWLVSQKLAGYSYSWSLFWKGWNANDAVSGSSQNMLSISEMRIIVIRPGYVGKANYKLYKGY